MRFVDSNDLELSLQRRVHAHHRGDEFEDDADACFRVVAAEMMVELPRRIGPTRWAASRMEAIRLLPPRRAIDSYRLPPLAPPVLVEDVVNVADELDLEGPQPQRLADELSGRDHQRMRERDDRPARPAPVGGRDLDDLVERDKVGPAGIRVWSLLLLGKDDCGGGAASHTRWG